MVDLEGRLEAVLGEVPALLVDAGVVDQHVQAVGEAVHLVGQRPHLAQRREVGEHHLDVVVAGRRADLAARRVRRDAASRPCSRTRAPADGKLASRLFADAVGRAGDHDRAAASVRLRPRPLLSPAPPYAPRPLRPPPASLVTCAARHLADGDLRRLRRPRKSSTLACAPPGAPARAAHDDVDWPSRHWRPRRRHGAAPADALRWVGATGVHDGRRAGRSSRAGRRTPRLPRGLASPLPHGQLPARAHAHPRLRHRARRRAARLGRAVPRGSRAVARPAPRPVDRRLHRRRPRDHRRHAGLHQDHRDRRRARRGRPPGRDLLAARRPPAAGAGQDHRDHRHQRRDARRPAADRRGPAAVPRVLGRLGPRRSQRPLRPGLSRLRAQHAHEPHVPATHARHAAPRPTPAVAHALLARRPRRALRHGRQAESPGARRRPRHGRDPARAAGPRCRNRA